MSRTNYLGPLLLLLAVAVAVSVVMVLWFALPVQAQSESTDNDTGDVPAQSESTDNDTGDESQSTGEYLIVFSDTDTLPTDYEQRIADLGGTVEDKYQGMGVVVASGLSEEAAERLESEEDVEAVDEDVERQWLDPPVEEPSVEEASSAEVEPTSASNPTTAPVYPRQWHLRAIKANEAWAKGRLGSSDVTVAILDSGIDYTHPDLAGRVDLTRSKSFVPTDDALVQTHFPGAHPTADLRFHGTHVAATVSSNATAAAGVTSQVTLMAVKVLRFNGKGATNGVLAGIRHAADHGADVINMSLGGSFSKQEESGHVAALNRAINYANRKGTVIVVAAGNANYDMDSNSDVYQAYCQSPHVVCVSATGPTSSGLNGPWNNVDTKAPYSNYGPPITVAAPGGTGTSPLGSSNRGGFVRAACSRTTLAGLPGVSPDDVPPSLAPCRTDPVGAILGVNGTSQAAPHASGLAALLVERIGKNKPSQVAAQVRNSADDRGDPDKDVIYGHGRINVANALNLVPSSP